MAQKVHEVMASHPVALPSDAPLMAAAKQMRNNDIGDVLVVDQDGRLRGIVTDRDIVVRARADGREARTTTVGEICSPQPLTVAPDDDLDRVVRLMRERAVRRIPVVDGDRPVGVVSLGDMAIEWDSSSTLAQISAAVENT